MSAIISLTDNFGGSSVDGSKWSFYGTVTEGSGVLTLNSNSGLDSLGTYDLTGSVAVNNAVSVKVNRVASNSGVSGVTNLVIANPAIDGTNLRISYDNSTGLISAQSQVGYADGSPTTLTYSSSVFVYWRIIEAAGTISFDHSIDGLVWSTLRTIPTSSAPWITNGSYHLSVDGTVTTSAQFSLFNVLPGGNSNLLTLNDTFDNTLNTAIWTTSGTPTPATGSGLLTIANTSTFGNIHTAKRYDATGGEISVNVTQVASTTTGTATTNLVLNSLETNTDARISYHQSDGLLHFRHQIAGSDPAEVTVTYDNNIHAWWRLRESGGTFYMETSPTGLAGSWVIQRQDVSTSIVTSTGAPYLPSIVATLSVDNGMAAIVGAQFDNLNNLPVGVASTKIDTLRDNFSVDTGAWDKNSTASIGSSVATVPDGDIHTASTYDLTGSVAIVKATQMAVGATAITNFIIDNPLVGGTSLRILRDNSTSNLFFSRFVGYGPDGTDTTAIADTVTYSNVNHLWWKIEEVNGTINFSTSPDGTNASWVIRHHIPTSTASWVTDMKVFMSVDNTATSPALFNQFNIPVGFTPVIDNYKAEALMDDFNGVTLDSSKWTVLGSGGVSVNDELQIAPVNTEIARGLESTQVYDLTESNFAVQATNSGIAGDEAVMRIRNATGTEDIRIVVTGTSITAGYYLGGVLTPAQGSVQWANATPVWIRVRETNDIAYCEYSSNGSFTDYPTPICVVTLGNPNWTANVKLQLLSDNTITPVVPVVTGFTTTTDTIPLGTDFTVDFRAASRRFPTEPLDKWSIGYGVGGSDSSMIINDTTADGIYRALGGPLTCRLAACGWEAGATPKMRQGSANLSQVSQKIISRGHSIYLVVVSNVPHAGDPNTDDNNFTSAEYMRALHYYNDNNGQNGGPVTRVAIGNEPVAGNDTWSRTPAQMASLFTSCWTAQQSAFPNVGITMPSAGDIVPQYTTDFMNAVTQSRVSGLSFHAYQGSQGGTYGSNEAAEVARLRSTYPGKYYGIEEFNWHFEYNNSGDDAGWYNWKNLVYQTELIGRVLYAGGHAYQFNCEGTMGLISNGGNGGGLNGQPAQYSRLPSYWAIAAFTGCTGNSAVARNAIGGYVVPVTGAVSGVYVWAVDVGKIIIVNQNTSGSAAITIGMGGCNPTGQYSVWQTIRNDVYQTTPYSVIATKANYSAGTISITVPYGTVTAIDVFA